MSASHSLQRTQMPHQPKAVGSFTTASTGAPTINQKDGVTSITRSNVGEFTIIFDEAAAFYNFCLRCVMFTTAAQSVYVESINPTTKTVVIQVVTAGSATPAETTGMRIDFDCEMRRS